MSKVRTALGRELDMAALERKYENIRAVSNLSVNARGDQIDSFGNVIESSNERVSKHYNKTVGNKTARPTPKKIETKELSSVEKELQEQLDQEDADIENLKKT